MYEKILQAAGYEKHSEAVRGVQCWIKHIIPILTLTAQPAFGLTNSTIAAEMPKASNIIWQTTIRRTV